MDKTKWLMWLNGFVNAGIHGICVGFSTVVIDPAQFNIHSGIGNLITVCTLSGVFSAFSWLKDSPLPIGTLTVQNTETPAPMPKAMP